MYPQRISYGLYSVWRKVCNRKENKKKHGLKLLWQFLTCTSLQHADSPWYQQFGPGNSETSATKASQNAGISDIFGAGNQEFPWAVTSRFIEVGMFSMFRNASGALSQTELWLGKILTARHSQWLSSFAWVSQLRRELMGCFARSTPLEVMHEVHKSWRCCYWTNSILPHLEGAEGRQREGSIWCTWLAGSWGSFTWYSMYFDASETHVHKYVSNSSSWRFFR